jgi:hypothetical protein
MIEFYQLAKQVAIFQQKNLESLNDLADGFLIREVIIILLPLVFIVKKFRDNKLLTLIMLLLIYLNNPINVWNNYNLYIKVPFYLSLFSAVYALLWLNNQLPHQTKLS